MRRVIVTIAILFGDPVWALTLMGPPANDVKQGEWLLGFGASGGESTLKFRGNGLSGRLKDVESNLYLGKVGLGLFDGCEVFGRFGVGEMEELGNELAWGLGARATFVKKDNVSWGALFQCMSHHAEEAGTLGRAMLNGDFNVREYQLAIGPTFNEDEASVYLGPFFHFIDGDADLLNFGSVDIQQRSEFGVYVGVLWELAENTSVNLEFQGTDDAGVAGIGLVKRFGGPSKP